MGRKSSIDRLAPEIKAYIQAKLASGSVTLDELIADLREKFPAAAQSAELPSRSAVGRYGQKLERRLLAIRASTEAAKLIQAHAGDDKDARSEALTAMVQTELFEAILALQEADEAGEDGEKADPGERVALLSKAAKNIATLTRSSINLKEFQSKVEEATRKKLLEEQRAKLEAMPNKGGVTADTKAAIREALGIV
ncbi:phage protein Gp27 family protein [Acidovorax sp.]|uniref:phage protein Gp27 family protein n=1 Tax=Acidovorax sp. TaxID=1872122 RepID=UPI0025B7CD95|nr:phage protein Gp27 family protein [Acidovorax sp.]